MSLCSGRYFYRAVEWLLAITSMALSSTTRPTLLWESKVGNTALREHSEEVWPGRKYWAMPNRKGEGEPGRD